MAKDDLHEVVDDLCNVLVHVPAHDAMAMADLCDWFCSLKFSPLRDGQQNRIRITEATARVLGKMIEQNHSYGTAFFLGVRKTLSISESASSNNKEMIKKLLMQELERIDQKADVKY